MPQDPTTDFTHAFAPSVRERDVTHEELVAFIRHANHCGCDAVRCEGLLVHQSGGFDGPHLATEYRVIRERDGAVMESLTLWRTERAEALAEAALACAAPDAEPLGSTRIRLDPHPVDTCALCL